MERVGHSVQIVDAANEGSKAFLEFGLLRLIVLDEQFLRFLREHLDFGERKVPGHDLFHLLADPVDLIVCDEVDLAASVLRLADLPDLAVQPAWQGMVDHQHLVRIEFPDGVLQHEAERAHVTSSPVRMIVADEFYLMQVHWFETQLLKLVVYQCGQHVGLLSRLLVRDALAAFVRQILQRLSLLDLVVLPVIDAEQSYLILLHFRFCYNKSFKDTQKCLQRYHCNNKLTYSGNAKTVTIPSYLTIKKKYFCFL